MILLWEVPNKLSTEAPLIIVSLEIFSLNSRNVVLFIVPFKMVLTFKSVDETPQCATIHKKSGCAVYKIGQVYYILFM